MTHDQTLAATALASWKMYVDRTEKFFFPLSDEQLQAEIAPGKNRLIYLFGHLIAVHDAMLPMIGIGPRRHPELDAPFLNEADRVAPNLPSGADLRTMWTEVHQALHAGFDRFTPAGWLERHSAVPAEDFAKN